MSYAVQHHLGSDGAWPAADKCVCVCVDVDTIVIVGGRKGGVYGGMFSLQHRPPLSCCVVIVKSDADFENFSPPTSTSLLTNFGPDLCS